MTFALPNSQIPTDVSLADAFNLVKKDVMLNLNCHHIGTVQSFNSTKQTATATINYKKTFFQLNATTGLYNPVLFDYPMLIDAPVIFLGGSLGQYGLTFPVVQGDECLILFNDRDIDNWFTGGGGGAVATPRLHSFADGIILVGLRSLGNVLQNFDTAHAALRGSKDGKTMVGVGATLVRIANSQYTLNGLLKTLISNINDLVTAVGNITVGPGTFSNGGGLVTGASGTPINAAAISNVASELSNTASQIAGLLE
jgi:hypothetical protein